LCEILGAIEEDDCNLISMPVGARPSIEEIRTNCEFYVVFKCSEKDAAGGKDWGFSIHRVILGPDGLGADITQACRNTFLSRIALSTGLKCAHQRYPKRGKTRIRSVHSRLNATALQIALQKMALLD
jgi:hypothetical protein